MTTPHEPGYSHKQSQSMNTKIVNGVKYWLRETEGGYCKGCAAERDDQLCKQLSGECQKGIWCNTERPTPLQPHKPDPVKLALHNYQQLAQAVQDAGGSVHILESHTVPQLLQTLARNRITIKATYEARH